MQLRAAVGVLKGTKARLDFLQLAIMQAGRKKTVSV